MKKLLFVFMLLLGSAAALTAQRAITGTVTDQNKEPLIGATILVEGTSVGTVTDALGEFGLTVPAGSSTLLISYTGYTTRRVELTAANNYSLTLETDAVTLSDVVVTAYGTTRKEALTGSVGSIKSEAIALRP
ncbi:MAG TPA: carboxypeptidase-like regulatory domain-containing protein, partial [Saprospiraceae bacterium]|nr:carboxypeptidase-like regulatory domain-containing protein [Saprospiraceae bacterium]